ncbi:cuticle protein 18.7-like [Cimex lectularius]|uniref:CPR type cuticle protein n=1 Tax=Cimex lectularius TaxID=79782 RepID=A0A8I6TJB2_CIMLE|nr:cuticle protein 18.7-like [Cimex lectularius]
MKQLLVFCAFVAAGSSRPDCRGPYYQEYARFNRDGSVADTPEVARAKVAHYAILAKAGGAVPHYPGQWISTPGSSPYSRSGYYWYDKERLNPDGTVAETLEVEHAKKGHFAAHAKARAYLGLPPVEVANNQVGAGATASRFAAHIGALRRSKRYAPAPLNPDGTVADTPEVATAKAQHFATVAKARAYNLIPVSYYTGGKWLGPPAPLNPDGTVADTPEVQAVKAAHFAAHAGARHGTLVFQPSTAYYG